MSSIAVSDQFRTIAEDDCKRTKVESYIQTRDKLLGRQIVARSPVACFCLALEETSPIANAI
jgi:hypothetical protein